MSARRPPQVETVGVVLVRKRGQRAQRWREAHPVPHALARRASVQDARLGRRRHAGWDDPGAACVRLRGTALPHTRRPRVWTRPAGFWSRRCGCMDGVPPRLDAPCGRVMGDVSSMFVVYLLEWWRWTADEPSAASLVVELWPAARAAARWQMDRSAESGLPTRLVDTYDGLRLSRYNVSCFSALFHLLAMAAARELALSPPVRDAAFAAECDAALARGRAAMDALLWVEGRGYYRSYTGGEALMSDSLYAQVLADTLGLGALTSDAQVTRHLAAVLQRNDSPYGLLCQTGRYPLPAGAGADNSIWMMANPNWASLSLRRGGDPHKALSVVNKTFGWVRDTLADQWNVVAVYGGLGYGAEGLPAANSHYGYHLVAWHLLFALTGQVYSARSRSLTFAPALRGRFELPVLVPAVAATLSRGSDGECTLAVAAAGSASLVLHTLSVDGVAPPAGVLPVKLALGQRVSWGGGAGARTKVTLSSLKPVD
uniref:Glycosyl-hydrolase family 116 catalytic region domain-containing protein n=1 Tax=Emiliania huxleyi TaxID=2903 RepID=A0A7S3W415_EMIHU